MITKITKGQQITIPAEIRKKLNLSVGTTVEIEIQDKEIIIKPLEEDLEKLFKEARKRKPKINLTVDEMEQLAEDGILR